MWVLVIHDATSNRHPSVDNSLDPVEFVRGDEDCTPCCGSVGDQSIDEIATALVESGVGFIEKPEFRTSSCGHGDGGAAALASRQTTNRNVEQPRLDLHSFRAGPLLCLGHTGGSTPETNVLAHREVVVEHRLMADVPHARPNRSAILKQIDIEHGGGPGFGSNQSRAQSQQGRLPGAVRPLEKNRLTSLDSQRRSGERGKAAKEYDDVIEFDHGHV